MAFIQSRKRYFITIKTKYIHTYHHSFLYKYNYQKYFSKSKNIFKNKVLSFEKQKINIIYTIYSIIKVEKKHLKLLLHTLSMQVSSNQVSIVSKFVTVSKAMKLYAEQFKTLFQIYVMSINFFKRSVTLIYYSNIRKINFCW